MTGPLAHYIWPLLPWLAGFFAAFTLLARLMPCNPGQPWRRRGAMTDVLYFFLMPPLGRLVRAGFLAAGFYVLFRGETHETLAFAMARGFGPLSRLPLWLQAALIALLSDMLLYWIHRLFHGRTMWRFHAVHHSSPLVDWLSTYRFHPVNIWLSFTLADALMLLMGFSPAAIAALAAANAIYSAMVHANLNWTFGPLRHVFASPVFHRWHHLAQGEGMHKNFAPTFPLLDHAFGTFFMPEDRLPERFGVAGSDIPDTFWGQMLWPFRRRRGRVAE